jgi:hypothetical protein
MVEMARAFTLVWSGPGIATFTATSHRHPEPGEFQQRRDGDDKLADHEADQYR